MIITNFITPAFLNNRKETIMAQPYFNTVPEVGEQLTIAIEKSASQNKLAEELFKAHPNTLLTAEQVHDTLHALGKLDKFKTPLTSIRRALNTLKDEGVLSKTEERKKGKYGHKISYYKLTPQS